MSLGTKSHALSHGERVTHITCGAGEGIDLKQSNTSSGATRHPSPQRRRVARSPDLIGARYHDDNRARYKETS